MSDLKEVQNILKSGSDASNQAFFEKMVPGQQKVYGVKTPVLNEIVKQFKSGSFELAEQLWNSGALEEKIIAIKIMEKKGKDDPERLIKMFNRFANGIDNWAVCDGLGMQFLSGIRNTHAEQIFKQAKKFNRSKEMWKRRLSLVMVEWYTRKKEHEPQIKELVKNLEDDKEYYVKKAVVWIRRNYMKQK